MKINNLIPIDKINELLTKKEVYIEYTSTSTKALYVGLLIKKLNNFFVIGLKEDVEKLYKDLMCFLEDAEIKELKILKEDIEPQVIYKLLANNVKMITTDKILDIKLPPTEYFENKQLFITLNMNLSKEKIITTLINIGYEYVEGQVSTIGEIASRGNIIDIYPVNKDNPIRIELFADNIDRITEFDLFTQNKKDELESIPIFPAKFNTADKTATILDILNKSTPLILVSEKNELPQYRNMFNKFDNIIHLSLFHHHHLLEINPIDSFYGDIEKFNKTVKELINNNYKIYIFTKQKEHFVNFLPAAPCISFIECELSSGFRIDDHKIAIFTDKEILPYFKHKKIKFDGLPTQSIFDKEDIKEDDYVVHINFGIAKYKGMIELNDNCYFLLQYANEDKLYVPIDKLDRIQKYICPDGKEPKLSTLGTARWELTKKRIKEKTKDIAAELLRLYSLRDTKEGFAFLPDNNWQKELEASFIYEETPDQKKAIEDVKRDMEVNRIMDRLICGDVGFGKTEIALRAAFKAVMSSKQVALIAPTTVLAYQHYDTFSKRLAGYPINLQLLSRFKTKKEQEEIIVGINNGEVDIVIGTHRLLQKDVRFKELGLLIIDEEQRFGVVQKEHLKQLKINVDTLALTATPIPRTLYMALTGIRDISLIETPPPDRLPIRTYLAQYDEKLIKDAIEKELNRGGQVYFVHNRIDNILGVAMKLKNLVPDSRICITHGRLDEDTLEQCMIDFIDHKYDILLTTTIIENGIDIPNANTIIINNADQFGLAQLYQLRGRVGRANKQAYAYLLYKSDKIMSTAAKKRLIALKEFTQLASGFKLAKRDLEIRGAGNLFGREQSGFIYEVGFELYCQLVREAVEELRKNKNKMWIGTEG